MTAGTEATVSEWVARALLESKISTIFGLQGGHIQPIWDEFTKKGGNVIDSRDERAAVHMAHAYSEVSGTIGVALVTAGPGVTNVATGVANAFKARVPLLVIGGAVPRPQRGLGALQEIPQVDLMKPITRMSETLLQPEELPDALVRANSKARGLEGVTAPGPVFLEIPTDVLRAETTWTGSAMSVLSNSPIQCREPNQGQVMAAVDMLWDAEKPLIIAGRGARGQSQRVIDLLDSSGAAYLDTQECRGLVPEEHWSFVGAMRGRAMAEADLVVTLGRKLDYQLGYGSRAVFPKARFLRIGESDEELRDNRVGDGELKCSIEHACTALLHESGKTRTYRHHSWVKALRAGHVKRSDALSFKMKCAEPGSDGLMHPHVLLAELRKFVDDQTIFIADGGDILSFARICVPARSYMDSGVFGCLGVGLPFAVGAAVARPGQKIVAIIGDGSFGFNVMELDTAVRHDAKVLFVIANNGGWNIERTDQIANFGGRIQGSELAFTDYAAMARATGLFAARVENPSDINETIRQALGNLPALLDVVVTRDAISPDAGSGLPGVPDFQALGSWDQEEQKLNKHEK